MVQETSNVYELRLKINSTQLIYTYADKQVKGEPFPGASISLVDFMNWHDLMEQWIKSITTMPEKLTNQMKTDFKFEARRKKNKDEIIFSLDMDEFKHEITYDIVTKTVSYPGRNEFTAPWGAFIYFMKVITDFMIDTMLRSVPE